MLGRRAYPVAVILSTALALGCSNKNPIKPKTPTPVQVTFAAPVAISGTGLGGTLSDFLVTDLNDDARPDLAVGMTDSSAIWVRFATGGSAFTPAKTFHCGYHPNTVAAANVTGGAINDLIVGGDGGVVLLQGLTGNEFGAPDTLVQFVQGTVRSITCADFNHDTAMDIAVVVDFAAGPNPAETDFVVVSGATRTVTDFVQTFGEIISSGDVDGDGWADIVIAGGTTSGVIGLYSGLGNGAFTSSLGANIGAYPLGLAMTDLNLDGSMEVGVAHADSPGIWSVRYSNLSLLVDSTYTSATAASGIASGDLNLDGRADFAASSLSSAAVDVLINNWNGKLQDARYFAADGPANQIAIADIDGDGKNDIVLAGPTNADGLRYLKNTSH